MRGSIGRLMCAGVSLMAAVVVPAQGVERHVPGQYAWIQQAVDACSDGDEVVIAPGTYTGDGNRDIQFKGKAITVRGTNPNDPALVAATVIACGGLDWERHRGFVLDSNSVLAGLTIQGGNHDIGAGVVSTGGVIRDCVIRSNKTMYGLYSLCQGGGVYGRGTLIRCVLENNSAGSDGGAAFGSWFVQDCVFHGNSANEGGAIYGSSTVIRSSFSGNGAGSGIATTTSVTLNGCLLVNDVLYAPGTMVLKNCTVVHNSGGVSFRLPNGGSAFISNCIFWGNYQIRLDGPTGSLAVHHSNMRGGQGSIRTGGGSVEWGPENIDADPTFRDPSVGDYHLARGSPCSDTGDGTRDRDLDGDPGVIDGDNDGAPIIDIGYDEAAPLLAVTPTVLEVVTYSARCPEDDQLRIRNDGAGTLVYSLSDDAAWLDVTPSSGDSVGEEDVIAVRFDTAAFVPGTYEATIAVQDYTTPERPGATVPVTLRVLPVPPDFNGDGDVDLADFNGFQACFNGPNLPPAENCPVDADFDDDGDVDLEDFLVFARCFNGPNNPPACG